MRITLEAGGEKSQDRPPVYSLQPETNEETRFLTALRDLAMKPGVFIAIVGTEDLEEARSGLPARPVVKMNLTIYDASPKPLFAADPKVPVAPGQGKRSHRPPNEGEILAVR